MPDKVIAAQLTLDTKPAEISMKTLKAQLKEATNNLHQMTEENGLFSKATQDAAKRVAELKDKIGDAKNLADAFNPDRKFQAFGNTIRGVAGGFTALTGTMALLGDQSEDVQKTLLKVQAALAISEGVNNVLELKDTFQQLGTFIKSTTIFQKANTAATALASVVMKAFGVSVETTSVGFKVLRTAIISTGIGALIVGITLLVSAISDWISGNDDVEKSEKALKASIEATTEAIDAQQHSEANATKEAVALAKAQGKSAEEIYKIQKAGQLEQQRLNEVKLRALYDTYEKEQDLDKHRKDDDEKSSEARKKYTEEFQKNEDLKVDIQIAGYAEQERIRKEGEDNAKKSAEKQKQKDKEDLEKSKQAIENEKKGNDELSKARQENTLARIRDEEERAKKKEQFDFINAKKSIEDQKISEDLKGELITAATEKRELAITAITEQFNKKRSEDAKASIEAGQEIIDKNLQKSLDAFNAQLAIKKELDDADKSEFQKKLDDLQKNYDDKKKIVGNNEQLQLELLHNFEKQKTALQAEEMRQRLDVASNLLGQAANLFNKDTAAYKVLAIAQATISTYQSATSAYAAMAKIPVVGPALGAVAAGLAIATGLKNIREIVKVKVPGGAGGSVPSISASVAAPLTPQPQVQTTTLDQNALNNTGNATVRAFVLESDISTNQSRISRLNRAARLGG